MHPTADPSTLRQFRDFARQSGIPLPQLVDRDHLDILEQLDTLPRVPASSTPNILQMCAIGSQRPGLGVAFAEWINLRKLGPLSLLWDHCSTLGEAMRVTQRYLHLESAAVGLDFVHEGDEIAIVHELLVDTAIGGSQFLEATLTSSVRVARLVLGDSWMPAAVEFGHSAGGDDRHHRRFFRSPLRFGCERYAIICTAEDFRRDTGTGNHQMLDFVEAHLSSFARQWPQDVTGQVEHLIQSRMAGGHATLPAIAEMMAMSTRTLQRRLAAEGGDFAAALERVRVRRTREYYRDETEPNLIQLAYLLGYSEPSAVSRFLREKLGMTGRMLRTKTAKPANRPPSRRRAH